MPGRMQFDFQFSQPQRRHRAGADDSPFRILLIGDFSGRGLRGECDPAALASRALLSIDPDNFEKVLQRVAPLVHVQAGVAGAGDLPIEFRSLDDFHPDRLYGQLSVFKSLRETRARLLDPATFAQAAAGLDLADAPDGNARVASPDAPAKENDAEVLERLLGAKPGGAPDVAADAASARGIDGLIRRLVAPHIVTDAPKFQQEYVAAVDAAIAQQLRSLLHATQFRALESSWRAIHWLVTSLQLDEQLQLHLLDVSRPEVNADLAAAGENLERSALYRCLIEEPSRAAEDHRWSLIAGLFRFERSGDDARVLAALAAIASQAGAPFLAEGAPQLLGCNSLLETPSPSQWQRADDDDDRTWQALRESAVARWIGLALPRILLRLPYGSKTDPVAGIEFEEVGSDVRHEDYLWGNPAIACVLLLGQSFRQNGWEMEPGDTLDIGDLPAHIVAEDGEKRMQACAEVFLTERAAEAILERGLIPVMSFRNRNAVRVLRLQSLAQPASALRGRWN